MKKPPTLDFSKVDGLYQSVDATGFEPATSASRTQRSTKLSHASIFMKHICCLSNRASLYYHKFFCLSRKILYFFNFFEISNKAA